MAPGADREYGTARLAIRMGMESMGNGDCSPVPASGSQMLDAVTECLAQTR
jgi:hypothetical protein